jgi:hypothetical protein
LAIQESLPRILRSSAYGRGVRLKEDLQTKGGEHYAINLKVEFICMGLAVPNCGFVVLKLLFI